MDQIRALLMLLAFCPSWLAPAISARAEATPEPPVPPTAPLSESDTTLPDCPEGEIVALMTEPAPTPQAPAQVKNAPGQLTAPPQLGQVPRIRPLGCRRTFVQKKKSQFVDSFHRYDADKLRPIMEGVPDAISELDAYQDNRRKVQIAGYMGTLGLLTVVGTLIAMNANKQEDDRINLQGIAIRNIGLPLGLLLGGGSFVYALSVLRTNESRLARAVGHYNAANPSTPIQLQFSTGVLFDI